MVEPVRLLIWDLDDTFWHGTLTEGGIRLIPGNHDLVVHLANRGIISTICSKNDFEAVKAVMVENGIWDYFVLPSINWQPKGPRVRAIIDTIGLRPRTVMFVDDNALHREEVRRFVPDIQVQTHTFVQEMWDNPLFRGKNDNDLSRLKQYKVLEKRKIDEAAAGADVTQFLRDSKIQVRLEFDVEPHLDRFIELINRTNQLNFTKERLPEDPEAARVEAGSMLGMYSRQAALVHARDRYGDHGYCGVYVHDSEERRLIHFAFSCRILGLGVEQWLYQRLGKPHINIQGEVLVNLLEDRGIDWITQTSDVHVSEEDSTEQPFDRVTARGGCDLGALIHYFTATSKDALGEYHLFRNGGTFRIDHSIFLRHAIRGLSQEQFAAAAKLGYERSDFDTRLFSSSGKNDVVLLSFFADQSKALYRHRATGLEIPFTVHVPHKEDHDMRELSEDHLTWEGGGGPKPWMIRALQYLHDEFDFVGCGDIAKLTSNLRLALEHFPRTTSVFVLAYLASVPRPDGSNGSVNGHFAATNKALSETCNDFTNVELIDPASVISTEDVIDHFHWRRPAFFKLYQTILRRLSHQPATFSGSPIGFLVEKTVGWLPAARKIRKRSRRYRDYP